MKQVDKHTIEKIKQKALHGRFFAELEQPDVDFKASHLWLKASNINPETEGFIFAIQDQVVNTKNYRKYIIKDPNITNNDKCRITYVSKVSGKNLRAKFYY